MKVSTSIMCVDFGRMAQDLALLNEFTDAYHWDIMDGHYVPNLALNLDMIASLRDDRSSPSTPTSWLPVPRTMSNSSWNWG